jgi:hypothetical protein
LKDNRKLKVQSSKQEKEMETINCENLDLDNGCQNRKCRHHVLWDELNLPDGKETEASLKFHNCMCLIYGELTLEETGQIWGLTRERIRQIELNALMKSGLTIRWQKKEDLLPKDLTFFKNRHAEWLRKKNFWRKGGDLNAET